MYQVIETTDQEKYEMYNSLEKNVLIGMLIQCNKHLDRIKPTVMLPEIVAGSCGWFTCSNSGGKCDKCGKHQWEH
jgi:hypothetical protein